MDSTAIQQALVQQVSQYISQYTPNPRIISYLPNEKGDVMGRFESQGRVFSFRLSGKGLVYKPVIPRKDGESDSSYALRFDTGSEILLEQLDFKHRTDAAKAYKPRPSITIGGATKKQSGDRKNPNCSAISYRCGVCISLGKNCIKNANTAALKDRLNKINSLARMAAKGQAVPQVKTGAIGAKTDPKSLMRKAQKQARELAKGGKTSTNPKAKSATVSLNPNEWGKDFDKNLATLKKVAKDIGVPNPSSAGYLLQGRYESLLDTPYVKALPPELNDNGESYFASLQGDVNRSLGMALKNKKESLEDKKRYGITWTSEREAKANEVLEKANTANHLAEKSGQKPPFPQAKQYATGEESAQTFRYFAEPKLNLTARGEKLVSKLKDEFLKQAGDEPKQSAKQKQAAQRAAAAPNKTTTLATPYPLTAQAQKRLERGESITDFDTYAISKKGDKFLVTDPQKFEDKGKLLDKAGLAQYMKSLESQPRAIKKSSSQNPVIPMSKDPDEMLRALRNGRLIGDKKQGYEIQERNGSYLITTMPNKSGDYSGVMSRKELVAFVKSGGDGSKFNREQSNSAQKNESNKDRDTIKNVEDFLNGQTSKLPEGTKKYKGYLIVSQDVKNAFTSSLGEEGKYSGRLQNDDGSEWLIDKVGRTNSRTIEEAIKRIQGDGKTIEGMTDSPKDNIIVKSRDGSYSVIGRYKKRDQSKAKSSEALNEFEKAVNEAKDYIPLTSDKPKRKPLTEIDKIQAEISEIKRGKKLLSAADEKRLNELNNKIDEIEFANRKPAPHDELTNKILNGESVRFKDSLGDVRTMTHKNGVTTITHPTKGEVYREKESPKTVDRMAESLHRQGSVVKDKPAVQGVGNTEAERRQFLLNTNTQETPKFVEPKREIELADVKTPQDHVKYATQELNIAKASKDPERINKWIEELQRAKKKLMASTQAANNTYQPDLFFVNKGNPNQRSLFDSAVFDAEYDDSVERNILSNIGLMISRAMAGNQTSPSTVQLRKVKYADGNVSGIFTQYGSQYDFEISSKGVVISPLKERQDRAERLDRISGIAYKKTAKIGANRKCGRGYKCKGTCISKNNKCRVNWASKEGLEQYKSMLKELDSLATPRFIEINGRQVAQRNSPEDMEKLAAMSRRVSEARKARQEFGAAYKAKTAKTYKIINDRVNAEVERRLKDANLSPNKVKSTLAELDPKDIAVDPKRFQYKITGEHTATGTVGSLQGVGKWDENLAGILQVWEDPKDGKTYVVNGHNRLAKANELGAEKVAVRYLEVPTHQEARTIGAMTNIAEGRGNALDAAKFFRDTNWTKEDLVKKGIPLKEKIATDGLAIAALEPNLFRQVIDGELPLERAAIIGGSGLNHEKQKSLVELLEKRKNINNSVLSELIDTVKYAGQKQEEQFDLFGNSTATVDLAVQRASLQSFVKQKLASEKKLFGTVSKSKSAKDLERGGNQIDIDQSSKIADEAATALKIFDAIKHNVGGVSDALNSASEKLASAKNKSEQDKIKRETYEQVLKAVQQENDKLLKGTKRSDSRQRIDSNYFGQSAADKDQILTYITDTSGNMMGVVQLGGIKYRFLKPVIGATVLTPISETSLGYLFDLAPDLSLVGCGEPLDKLVTF